MSFPTLLLLLAITLIALGWNGSSSGGYFSSFYDGADPELILGEPQDIRTDEWKVGTPLIIAQAEQGFPAINETFPGGMDAALPYDLPRLDWSMAFRPHLVGYLLLDVDHGTASRWWVSGLSLVAAAFVFVVTILPRRPLVAAMLAIGFFASPFFQWWYQSTTFWPVTWALVTMAAVRWAVISKRRSERWVWALLIFYLTVVMAMGIYVPFIVPVIFITALFAIGVLFDRSRAGQPWSRLLFSVVPVLVAGAVAVAVVAFWLASRRDAVDAFLSTVYPGTRLTLTGSATAESIARTVSSSFSEALTNANGWLGVNSSEAATFFLAGLWLIPVLIWLMWSRLLRRVRLPWAAIGTVAAALIFAAFALVPGWDPIAHAMFLDRSTADRMRIGVGLASFTLIAVLVSEFDRRVDRPKQWVPVLTATVFVAAQVAVAIAVVAVLGWDRLVHDAPFWWLFAVASAACLYCFASGHIISASGIFLGVSIMSSLLVNPVYSGVLDLRDTELSHSVIRVDGGDGGAWVGVGDSALTAVLVESGVRTFNGTQGSPSDEMWEAIDPDGRFAGAWNRIGTVSWIPGIGEPSVANPAPDQIVGSFDACSEFAQAHVQHVLSDQFLPNNCLRSTGFVGTIDDSLMIYDVVAP